MLIKSQNKAFLLNFSNLFVAYIVRDDEGFAISSLEDENRYRLGIYSSKAKAMKVLDMIQEAYTKTGLAKAIVSEMAKVLGRASAGLDDELAKSTGKALVKLMCFQMPADSEVEA